MRDVKENSAILGASGDAFDKAFLVGLVSFFSESGSNRIVLKLVRR